MALPLPARISGAALRSLARLAESPAIASTLQKVLRAELRLDLVSTQPDDCYAEVPLDVRARQARAPRHGEHRGLPWPSAGWAPTSESLGAMYRSGETTPLAVTEAALAEARRLASERPSVGPLCDYADEVALHEAELATARIHHGAPRGPFDGIPVAIKEQTAVRGLPHRSGTTWKSGAAKDSDGAAVARLRGAGAIILGTTPMTELGMSPAGASSRRTLPRNPHATDRLAGGSSTGSGVAVATGLVPMALGVDGGGSIRIPAALCGVFGLKPTWGRVSRSGDSGDGTVAHLGPIASSTVDLARTLEIMSGVDAEDPETFAAPARDAGSFLDALGRGVSGLVVGVDEQALADCDPTVARACDIALRGLERGGARLRALRGTLLQVAAPIGYMTITAEALASVRDGWRDHREDMGPDVRVAFASASSIRAPELLEAARLRSGLRREMVGHFQSYDLIVRPTTRAPARKVTDREMDSGFLDARLVDDLCAHCFLANLTGLPAASVPVGADGDGMPLAVQILGDAWDEASVLAAAAELEREQIAQVRRPAKAARGYRASS